MSVIYLLASLPHLSLDTPPALTKDAFLATCADQLSHEDALACEALLANKESGHPFVKEWRDKEAVLKNTTVRGRAQARGLDATRWLRRTSACDVALERAAESAFQEKDPMVRERALDRALWNAAEETGGVDPLSKKKVFAYAVKLAIALKWQDLDEAEGRKKFERLTEVPLSL